MRELYNLIVLLHANSPHNDSDKGDFNMTFTDYACLWSCVVPVYYNSNLMAETVLYQISIIISSSGIIVSFHGQSIVMAMGFQESRSFFIQLVFK